LPLSPHYADQEDSDETFTGRTLLLSEANVHQGDCPRKNFSGRFSNFIWGSALAIKGPFSAR
jgi:hypothetical protein